MLRNFSPKPRALARGAGFTFLTHPLNINQAKIIWPLARFLPRFAIKLFLKNTPPFKILKIKNIRSVQDKEINGIVIFIPLLPEQIIESGAQFTPPPVKPRVLARGAGFTLERIDAAIDIAQESNADILGLGGLFSENKELSAKKFKFPVTCGTFLTAWSIIEAVYRTAKVKKIDLEKSSLAVIGASSRIGTLCARKFAEYVSKIIITGSDNKDLASLKQTIDMHRTSTALNIQIELDIDKAIRESDVVVIVSNAYVGWSMNTENFKPGAIICDIGSMDNVSKLTGIRRDLTVVKAGLVKLPDIIKFPFDEGFTRNIVSASLAETMLSTFENKFFSPDVTDSMDKLEEMADIAVQHGFEIWVPDAPVL